MDNQLFVDSFVQVKDVIVPMLPYLGVALVLGFVAFFMKK